MVDARLVTAARAAKIGVRGGSGVCSRRKPPHFTQVSRVLRAPARFQDKQNEVHALLRFRDQVKEAHSSSGMADLDLSEDELADLERRANADTFDLDEDDIDGDSSEL